jgi:acyl-CoA synthetase (AMP-forming)/AMP-acid ligase II
MFSQRDSVRAEPVANAGKSAIAFDDSGDVGLTDYVLGGTKAADQLAIVDRSRDGRPREWTYPALKSAVYRLAAHLRGIGIGEDDVVAVLTESSAEFVIAYHGVLAAGGVVLPLDPRGTESGWTAESADCHAKAIIVETALWAAPPRPERKVVHIGQTQDDSARWPDAIEPPPSHGEPAGAALGGDRRAVLMSSSGTQGTPKKVVVTHRNLTAGLAQIACVHRISGGEAVACVGPLRHIYGMQMAMNPVLRAGGTLVIPSSRFRLADFLAAVREHRVAVAYLVPSVIVELADLPAPPPLPGLRLIVSGGGPLAASAATGCARLTGVPVVQGFGMTEAGCVSFTPDGRPGPVGSAGVILPGTEALFADPETGEELPSGQAGELWLRGPQLAPGYLDDPAVPGADVRDHDGWFHTGDLAVLDPGGYLRIVGRRKSLIKYKGHQVAPAELEAILLTHSAVVDALVVGEPDPAAGELPKAFVVSSREVPLGEITAYVAAKVAPHKRIRRIERVREIPRSAMGKAARPAPLRVIVADDSTGFGRDFAVALVRAGASVLITGEEALADTACAAFSGVDVFVDTTTTGLVRAVLPRMAAENWGRIIVSDTGLVAELAAELIGTEVSAVGYDPGHAPADALGLVALATGAADHLSGSYATPKDLERP